jgi:hypothetical protein
VPSGQASVAALLPGMPRRHWSTALYEVAEAAEEDTRRDRGRLARHQGRAPLDEVGKEVRAARG